ncbi:late competence development ComFB family protein [Vibrio sp. SCSIO 43136]|uniref:late competence development ComFB family protein n=1 Tax=Vibrio sp. SCSIO 43136 TaxID=2819101 RepID=UPI0020763AD1|nr:late competence development ComFB family protein [Vibrio sp. SCSIO 43136]USD68236.1 late competence development ComFB family protein [Vibrio sp. SCSIO 43136]
MQISVDVHNYMETLVGHRLALEYYTDKYSSDQLADLACITLNQLRPIYIRHDIDFLSSLPEEKFVAINKQVDAALDGAETMLDNDRREARSDELPVIYSKPRRFEDNELEWYEEPLLKRSQSNNGG